MCSCQCHRTYLGREHAGFREGYSTIDHAFVLHLVIELYQSVRKRVFCAFIDYRKAFDSIIRSLIWHIISYNINGKVLNIIRETYSKAKSCIRKDNNNNTIIIIYSSISNIQFNRNLFSALYISRCVQQVLTRTCNLKITYIITIDI